MKKQEAENRVEMVDICKSYIISQILDLMQTDWMVAMFWLRDSENQHQLMKKDNTVIKQTRNMWVLIYCRYIQPNFKQKCHKSP